MRVAYIMSRFPTLTETFILNEMLALESMGVVVDVFPLLRVERRVNHQECERFVRRAHFHPFLSLGILRANGHYFRRQPRRYVRLLYDVLRQAWGSANVFLGAIGIFPKSVRFAYQMQRDGVDHVHAHFANHPAVAGMIIARLTGIPFSFTAHGSDLHVDRRMLALKVEAAEFGVTISQYNRDMILRECGEHVAHKIHVIHCGIDPTVFVAGSRANRHGPLRILCVGSLVEVKGHRYLLEACGLLRERGVDFVLDLVGEGKLKRPLERLAARLNLHHRVRFRGGLSRREVAQLCQEADVAALTSVPTRSGKREGIPVVLMEAMASALPVVSSRLSGIPELVEHRRTGFLTEPRDTAAVANALEELSGNLAVRLSLGREGRARVLRDFDQLSNTRSLFDLFQRSLGRDKVKQRTGTHG